MINHIDLNIQREREGVGVFLALVTRPYPKSVVISSRYIFQELQPQVKTCRVSTSTTEL